MKYRKKPVVIEAIQFTGRNDDEIFAFCSTRVVRHPIDNRPNLFIETLEGDMLVSIGDWVIRGVMGEFYPIKNVIFLQTYEVVGE